MAIGTDAAIDFFGTQDHVDDTTTSAVSNNALSVAADITTWTNDDDATHAAFFLIAVFGGTPTGGSVDLYAQHKDIDGTTDATVPATTNLQYYIGSFAVSLTGTGTNAVCMAKLPNVETSQQYDFYILNNGTGQSLSANWDLLITPISVGPHA